MTLNAVQGKPLPIYGNGSNIRDWLHVEDHCIAINKVLSEGKPGQVFNIGGKSERTNLTIVKNICSILDRIRPRTDGCSYAEQISFVRDRQGHDFRYAIDTSKIENELNWSPQHNFEEGLEETVAWYLDNAEWVSHVQSGEYQKWIARNYEGRFK